MKKLSFLFLLLLLASPVILSAQATVAEETIEADDEFYQYCLLIGRPRAFTNKISVSVDFGEERAFFQDTRLRDEQTGKVKTFNSMIDALNFMGQDGWKFVQAYVVFENNLSNIHWILRKRAPVPVSKD